MHVGWLLFKMVICIHQFCRNFKTSLATERAHKPGSFGGEAKVFASVLLKQSAKQHLNRFAFVFFKVRFTCRLARRRNSESGFLGQHISHRASHIDSVRSVTSVALTFNTLECWAAFEIQKNLCTF
jgi:hypothetical protein